MDQQMPFGELLRRHRLAAGLSQESLAERSRISARAISDLERGARRQPYRSTVAQLAQALGLRHADHAALLAASHGDRHAVSPSRATFDHALLTTKLLPPAARAALVDRPRLLDRLEQGLRGPLTLIAAPAGSGKTTLLSAWRRATENAGVPLAWVSLDTGDNDPVRFWMYVLTAIDTAVPGSATPALTLLQAPRVRTGSVPSHEAVLVALVNRLSTVSTPLILALDDLHAITAPEIQRELAFLVDHLPPSLHLLLVSRTDRSLPLAQLRAHGAVLEIRGPDLRFTTEEAAAFLTTVMKLPLSDEDIALLQARTEGWITGLQLAALSLQARENAEEIGPFIQAFAGSHRYVLDYLIDEVLRRQSETVQRFLLHTCNLERLCASLCSAVAGDEGGEQERVRASQRLLEQLERSNVFVIALDDERNWYRYHHLFADALRQRLLEIEGPAKAAILHERAADWFEQRGLLVEAINHAMKAENHLRAAGLLEHIAPDLLMQGEVQSVRAWLDALPDRVWHMYPRLCVAKAWLAADLHTFDTIEQYLRLAQEALRMSADRDTPNTRGEIAITHAFLAALSGESAGVIADITEAFALMDAGNTIMRCMAFSFLAGAYGSEGNSELAIQTIVQGVTEARRSGYTSMALLLVEDQTYFQRALGRLSQARETCSEALSWTNMEGARFVPYAQGVLRSFADLLCECGDLDGASQYIEQALAQPAQIGAASTQAMNMLVLARVRKAQGDLDGALTALKAVATPYQASESEAVALIAAIGDGFLAQIYLAKDDLAAAESRIQRLSRPRNLALLTLSPQVYLYYYEHAQLAPVQVLIAKGRAGGDPVPLQSALDLLAHDIALANQQPMPVQRIKSEILRALAFDLLGREAAASAALIRALKLAEPEHYVRTFIEEGAPMAMLLTRLLETVGDGSPDAEFPARYIRTLLEPEPP